MITILLIYDAVKLLSESGFVLVCITSFALFAMLLNFVILLGRISDIYGNAFLYVIIHGLQDLLHVASATTSIILAGTIKITVEKLEKIGNIFS